MKRRMHYLAAVLALILLFSQSFTVLAETGLAVNQEEVTDSVSADTENSDEENSDEGNLDTENSDEGNPDEGNSDEENSDKENSNVGNSGEEKESEENEIEEQPEENQEEKEGEESDNKEISDIESKLTEDAKSSEKKQLEYDDSYITSFEPLEKTELYYEYKLGLERLMEDFPTTIGITLGGTVSYDTSEIPEVKDGINIAAAVTWKCLQNYDEKLGTYDFVPDFDDTKLIDGIKLPQITVIVGNEEEGTVGGYLPEIKNYEIPVVENDAENRDYGSAVLQSYYNGYEEGYLPQIRNQGSEGACWAFASIGAMEADLLKDGRVSDVDMAELHAAYFSAHDVTDPKGCRTDRVEYKGSNYLSNGGCDELTYRSMASLIGTVEESYMPYSKGRNYVPDDAMAMNFNYASLKGAYQINVEDHDSIKQAIIDHGAVTASYYAREGTYTDGSGNEYEVRYSATYNSYYGQLPRTNHRIMIVGWDDNFSKDNFYEGCKPDRDGAWLVRNSWGLDDYGNRGYFWLSYYDCGLLSSSGMVAYDIDFDSYDHVYGYNGTWLSGYYSFYDPVKITQSFKVTGNEDVTAIGIETASADLTIDVTVSDGSRTVSGNMSTSLAGFYVIPLNEKLTVTKDSIVELTINISSEDGTIKILCDYSYNGYGDLNFIANKDSDVKVNNSELQRDLVIKMYTNDNSAQMEKTASLKEDSVYAHVGTQKQLELTEDSTVSMSEITWRSLETTVATVDSNGLITVGSAKGATKVVGTCPDGSIVSCDVKVQPYTIEYVVPDDIRIIRMDKEYYPGDSEHCNLPQYYYCGIYRPGYILDGWYTDEALTQPITNDDLMSMTENIIVYPKWSQTYVRLNYYGVDDDGNYTSQYYQMSGNIFTSMIPCDISKFTDPVSKVNNMLKTYNTTHDPLQFSYWSRDKEGKKRLDQLTVKDIDMELVNGGSEYAYYSQAREIYLYPQFVEVGAPSVEQIALLLNGMVGVKFYCDFSSVKQDILNNGYVILTGSRYERNIPISSADKVTEDGKTYYTFTYEVAAKEMDLNIKLSIYDGSGQALSIKNGNAAGNTAFAYSVYDYLKSAEDITDTNHLALTRAMASYGAMSEGLFEGRTYEQTMKQLQAVIGEESADDEMKLFNNISASTLKGYTKSEAGTLPEGLTYYGTSLVLDSGTSIRHYFKLSPGYSMSQYNFSIGSDELTPVKVNDGLYYIESSQNIPAAQYQNTYTVSVGNYSLSYSVYSYIYAVLKGNNSESLTNVVKAMYLYGEAARNYFN